MWPGSERSPSAMSSICSGVVSGAKRNMAMWRSTPRIFPDPDDPEPARARSRRGDGGSEQGLVGAAVDREGGTGDEAGVIAAEEGGDRPEVLGPTHRLHGRLGRGPAEV